MYYNPINERIKYEYFNYMFGADKKSEKTIEQARKAIVEYEKFTGFAPFYKFTKKQGMDYKKSLQNRKGQRSGEMIKPTTLRNLIKPVTRCLRWVASQRAYRSKMNITDIDYLDLSDNEARSLIMPDYKDFPSLEMLEKAVRNYPQDTEMQKRDCAIVAFTVLTAVRDDALVSLKLRHVEKNKRVLNQFASDGVNTKYRKNFKTFFFPFIDSIFEEISMNYIDFLVKEKLFTRNDPIFPSMLSSLNEEHEFIREQLSKEHLAGASSVRSAFKLVFEHSGLEYYNPHSVRDTLMQLAYDNNLSTTDMMAWSANFGHSSVNVSLRSYGGKLSDNDRESLFRKMDKQEA